MMSSAVERWKARLLTLSPSECAELAHFLLSSLELKDEDVEAAWDTEAARRVEDIRAGQATGRPFEGLFTDMREQSP